MSMIRLLDDDFSVISRRFGCQKFRREAEDLLARLRFTTASTEAALSRFRFRLQQSHLGCKVPQVHQRKGTENCLFLFFQKREVSRFGATRSPGVTPSIDHCYLIKYHFQNLIPGAKMSQKERGGSSSGPPPENLNQVKNTPSSNKTQPNHV